MCLAIPGKIIEIKEGKFVIGYGEEKRTVETSAVDVKKGDYVIVSNKIIINKLTKEQAEKFFELLE
jgi:hydrogenase assembly chaperone HypC/HupF